MGSTTSVVASEGIVRKTQFPRLVIPMSIVLTSVFNLCMNLIAVFLLVWSMNKHLKRLPKSFDSEADGTEGADPDLTTENPADGTKRESP